MFVNKRTAMPKRKDKKIFGKTARRTKRVNRVDAVQQGGIRF